MRRLRRDGFLLRCTDHVTFHHNLIGHRRDIGPRPPTPQHRRIDLDRGIGPRPPTPQHRRIDLDRGINPRPPTPQHRRINLDRGINPRPPILPGQRTVPRNTYNPSPNSGSSSDYYSPPIYSREELDVFHRNQDRRAFKTLVSGGGTVRSVIKKDPVGVLRNGTNLLRVLPEAAVEAAYPRSGGFNYPQVPVNASSPPRPRRAPWMPAR